MEHLRLTFIFECYICWGAKALMVRQVLHFKPYNFPSKVVGK